MVDWLKYFQTRLGPLSEFSALFGLYNVNHFRGFLKGYLKWQANNLHLHKNKKNKTESYTAIFLVRLRNVIMIEPDIVRSRETLEPLYFKWNNLSSWLQV